jgi:hypothetical protein
MHRLDIIRIRKPRVGLNGHRRASDQTSPRLRIDLAIPSSAWHLREKGRELGLNYQPDAMTSGRAPLSTRKSSLGQKGGCYRMRVGSRREEKAAAPPPRDRRLRLVSSGRGFDRSMVGRENANPATPPTPPPVNNSTRPLPRPACLGAPSSFSFPRLLRKIAPREFH